MSTQTTRPVVVGYDDSPAGELALEWAVREADRLDRPLKVVVARGMLWSTSPGFGPAVPWPEDLDQQLVARAKEHVASLSPRGEVTTESVLGTPAAVLVTESEDAELVVVGRRHHSKLGELVEGSTSAQVVAHASCPVVVADRPGSTDPDAPVVVAVDGSTANEPALAFAFERAASVAAPVVAVHSWTLDVPDTFDTAWLSAEHIVELESHEQKVLERAENAQMIVVGSRGHGGFVGLLLGSVSQGLLHRDRPCPLAVVHAERSES